MTFRVEIISRFPDTRALSLAKKLSDQVKLNAIHWLDVYTIDKDFDEKTRLKIAGALHNPASQTFFITPATAVQKPSHTWALEIGYLPGVTDNIGHTAEELIIDLLGKKFNGDEHVYSSRLLLIDGTVSEDDVKKIAAKIYNPLIQRATIYAAGKASNDIYVPKVKLHENTTTIDVDLDVDDKTLEDIGNNGIRDTDGKARGPLGLGIDYMKAIQAYFKKLGRKPKDIELEMLAQSWSEHCKHTIFADPIDEVAEGIFKYYIKRATQEVRRKKGKKDFCVSVFTDNAGGIIFDKNWIITDKCETHNTPSALDPFGGSITGIVGVNRDALGFGLGSKPIINRYGFCLPNPDDTRVFYRSKNKQNPLLPSTFLMDGIIQGVNAGGNCSGIPSPQGFLYFDDSYRGKPLVFAGTVGLIPRMVGTNLSHVKSAQVGDKIIMVGGRVGKDGIHGATFSSVELDEGSPVTAVQIGDPITQKKFSDVIVREARDQSLYHAITDNGAGGLSSSIGEMGRDTNGFSVDLEKVPLKYPGLAPWQIWISESQERMTLAVPPANVDTLIDLFARRGVEATVIGEFTDSGKAVVRYNQNTILDLDMDFLEDGLPQRQLQTTFVHGGTDDPSLETLNIETTLFDLLSRPNICSKEFVATQYDHEVQGSSVVKPLQGKGRVYADSTVSRPLLNNNRAVVTSHGLLPRYSLIDTYDMAAASIDLAVRNALAVGGDIYHLALMDNFCWCSSTEPARLGQLKRAAEACYATAVAYGTPFISGKDSMFNDFKGYDANDQPVKISALPTLLVSALGVMKNYHQAISLDLKSPGDLVYILGVTHEELGASELYAHLGDQEGRDIIGKTLPETHASKFAKLYKRFSTATSQNLIASAIAIGLGGVGVALAKKSIAGYLGVDIDLGLLPMDGALPSDAALLFSESTGRFVVSIAPFNQQPFEKLFAGLPFARIGRVTPDPALKIKGTNGKPIIQTDVFKLEAAYKDPFKDF